MELTNGLNIRVWLKAERTARDRSSIAKVPCVFCRVLLFGHFWFVRLPTSLVRASQVHMMASVHKGLKREPSEPEDGQPERVSDPGSLGRLAGGVDSNEPPESERVQQVMSPSLRRVLQRCGLCRPGQTLVS